MQDMPETFNVASVIFDSPYSFLFSSLLIFTHMTQTYNFVPATFRFPFFK